MVLLATVLIAGSTYEVKYTVTAVSFSAHEVIYIYIEYIWHLGDLFAPGTYLAIMSRVPVAGCFFCFFLDLYVQ